MPGVAAEARPGLSPCDGGCSAMGWRGHLGPGRICFHWFCILGILVMFGGSTQPSGALELLRVISLSPLGSQGAPVMKGMLRKEVVFVFRKWSLFF